MGIESKEQYLPEDADILNELEAYRIPKTPKVGGLAQLAELQIKATLRNRKTAHNLDESTKKYSNILIAFALVQIVFAALEFLFNATTSPHPILGDFTLFIAIGFAVWIVATATPKDKKDKND